MYLHASNDAIIIILIVCSFTSSYVSMGITIAHYIVYYQIIVTQPSRGTWNSVYKLQHIWYKPFSRRVMKCSVWVLKLLNHLAKHVHLPPTTPHTHQSGNPALTPATDLYS